MLILLVASPCRRQVILGFLGNQQTVCSRFIYINNFIYALSLPLLQEHANKILAAVQGNKRDTLLDAREIQDICLTGSIENIELALYWLHGQGLAAVTHFKCDGRLLAKFGKLPGEKIVISEVDYGVYSLKWNEKKLSESLAKLEAQVDAAVTDAREYVRKGNRSLVRNEPCAL